MAKLEDIEAKLKTVKEETEKLEQERKELEEQRETEWHNYFMKMACLAALRSKDPSTAIGAVIVDTEQRQIVGIGYNSMPYVKGDDNDTCTTFPWKGSNKLNKSDYQDLDLKYLYVVHAAVNAIANKTRENIRGCTIYLTHKPDIDCAQAIITAGISTVKYCTFTRRDIENRESQSDVLNGEKILTVNGIVPEMFPMGEEIPEVILLNDRLQKAKDRHKDGAVASEKADDYISWDDFFMRIARLAKTRPGADRRPEYAQGACIVNEHNQLVSIGFSGYPEGMKPTEKQQKEEQWPYIRHAEYKAILQGPLSVRGCTLYVTKYPCNICAQLIVQSGITKVVYKKDGAADPQEPKYAVYESSRRILTQCLEKKKKIMKFE